MQNILLAVLIVVFSPFVLSAPAQATKVGIGGNLDWFCGACDYYQGAVFVNAFKQSRIFGNANAAWNNDGFTYDKNGIPINRTDFGALIFDSLVTPLPDTEGVWTVRATGANVTFLHSTLHNCCGALYNWSYDPQAMVSTANFNCSATCLDLDLNFHVNSGAITNIECIRPGYPVNGYQMFTNKYLEIMSGFNNHRFMDWAATNGNPIRNWTERNTLNTVQYSNGKGIPWEAVIELSNVLGTNMWVNIPYYATDDYILQMAKLFKQLVSPNLIIYLEFSNEVWNSGFSQTQDSYVTGPKLYHSGGYNFLDYDNSSNIWYMGYRYCTWRSYVASNIWRSVWGDAAINTNVRVVLNGQLWSIWGTVGLGMIDTVFGPPSNFFYALSVAPYFDMANKSLDSTVDSVWQQLDLGSKKVMTSMTDNIVLAHRYGLEILCYEGGAEVGEGTNTTNRALVGSDPRMTGTIQNYLVSMLSSGVRLFNYYFVGMNTFSGKNDWGVLQSMNDLTSPKYVGIRNVLNANKADYEYTYVPPPGLALTSADWSFVPQSELTWPTSWSLDRWNTWQHAWGEDQPNGAYYTVNVTYSLPTPQTFTFKLNNKVICTFTLPNTSNHLVNVTACTILTVPRTNVFFWNITSGFPAAGGYMPLIRFTRTSQVPPAYNWPPMSYPPQGSSTGQSTTSQSTAGQSTTRPSTTSQSATSQSTSPSHDHSAASHIVAFNALCFVLVLLLAVLY